MSTITICDISTNLLVASNTFYCEYGICLPPGTSNIEMVCFTNYLTTAEKSRLVRALEKTIDPPEPAWPILIMFAITLAWIWRGSRRSE